MFYLPLKWEPRNITCSNEFTVSVIRHVSAVGLICFSHSRTWTTFLEKSLTVSLSDPCASYDVCTYGESCMVLSDAQNPVCVQPCYSVSDDNDVIYMCDDSSQVCSLDVNSEDSHCRWEWVIGLLARPHTSGPRVRDVPLDILWGD